MRKQPNSGLSRCRKLSSHRAGLRPERLTASLPWQEFRHSWGPLRETPKPGMSCLTGVSWHCNARTHRHCSTVVWPGGRGILWNVDAILFSLQTACAGREFFPEYAVVFGQDGWPAPAVALCFSEKARVLVQIPQVPANRPRIPPLFGDHPRRGSLKSLIAERRRYPFFACFFV